MRELGMHAEDYRRAQKGIAELKAAVVSLLEKQPALTNAAVGRTLGIYAGHKGHEGHISRTILAMLEQEGVVEQSVSDQTWSIRRHIGD
jgi:hypothetical protein